MERLCFLGVRKVEVFCIVGPVRPQTATLEPHHDQLQIVIRFRVVSGATN